ncbi:hypothetical protein HW452_04440 [Halomonas aquamarina]|uniref:Uncharacterized protein n=1 Tax=Vreelandella aquamarina TaxID=77097 RepID=A0ACC5VSP8_9GAMM|nr:hypothetical protein [Halomonas aquamarina]MBZ5486771.1 hypothetical protein [Halomonas aquamarina]
MKRLAGVILYGVIGSTLPILTAAADDTLPAIAYATPTSELMQLDNGVVLEGSDLSSLDTYTSGFRFTAGFSPWQLPRLDIGAEIAYRESDEVPIASSMTPLIMDTLSLGGALVAGIRMGAVSMYAKSGLTEWRGETNLPQGDEGGTTWLQGFGATLTINRLITRLEYERVDAPTLSHLNHLSASLHLPF